MTSIVAGAAQAAHAAAANIIKAAQITAGSDIPANLTVKEGGPENSVELDFSGKFIILGVPGAFTPSCSSQVPGFIKDADKFKAKGVKNVYVIAVNDAFVVKAWKEKLAPEGTSVRFITDDKGSFTTGLGLIFDATGLLGAPRSKRYVICGENNKVISVALEEDPGAVTVTAADSVLASL